MSKLPIRHQPAKSDVEHERDFWAWKYERREAECEELAGRLRRLLGACKQWRFQREGTGAPYFSEESELFDAIDKAEPHDEHPVEENQ